MGIAFASGDIVTLKGWSNATATIRAILNIRPVDWGPPIRDMGNPYPIMLETDLASSRAQGTVNFQMIGDGVIDDAVVNYTSSTSLVRGQCYVQLLLQRGGTTESALSVLTAGYVWGGFTNGGHLPSLYHIEEPGPAGGHGQPRTIALSAPAAGADFAPPAVPAGGFWNPRGFRAQLVTAVAAASRIFAIFYQDSSGLDIGGNVASDVQTTTQTEDYFGISGTIGTSLSTDITPGAISIGVGTNVPLLASYTVNFKTFNINAGDQWGAGKFAVEDWVMPN